MPASDQIQLTLVVCATQPETCIPNCHVNPHSDICRRMPLVLQDLKYVGEGGCQALTSESDLQGKFAAPWHNLFNTFALSREMDCFR